MSAHDDRTLSLLFGSDASQILQFLNSSSSNYTGTFQSLPPAPPLTAPSIGPLPPVSGTAGEFGVAPHALGGLPNIFSGIGRPNEQVLIPIVAILSGFIAVIVFRKMSVVRMSKKRTLIGLELDVCLSPTASLDAKNPRN